MWGHQQVKKKHSPSYAALILVSWLLFSYPVMSRPSWILTS